MIDRLEGVRRLTFCGQAHIEAGAARGRRIASWPSLKTDLRNAGAEWVDEEVVVDGNLVSSRKPDDIPAFNRETINVFSRARVHAR